MTEGKKGRRVEVEKMRRIEDEKKLELSSASLRNWGDGMVEYWNDGKASFGRINACGEKREAEKWQYLIMRERGGLPPCLFSDRLLHYSNIPLFLTWNMQNGWLGIPYYQHFVEFPRHQITKKEEPNSQPMQSCKQSMQPPLTTHHSPFTIHHSPMTNDHNEQ